MKKIPTLFPKDPTNLGRVIQGPSLFPIDKLEFKIKVDGTACYMLAGQPYVRYDAKLIKHKRGKIVKVLTKEEALLTLPEGAIPCQEPDELSGHWPHWVKLFDQPEYGYQKKGYELSQPNTDGSYECVGLGINGNPHGEEKTLWVHHQSDKLLVDIQLSQDNCYSELQEFLKDFSYEGLVAYKKEVPVAKIRRCDFGYAPIQFLKVSEL
jgi:hypothetical protein